MLRLSFPGCYFHSVFLLVKLSFNPVGQHPSSLNQKTLCKFLESAYQIFFCDMIDVMPSNVNMKAEDLTGVCICFLFDKSVTS